MYFYLFIYTEFFSILIKVKTNNMFRILFSQLHFYINLIDFINQCIKYETLIPQYLGKL